MPIQTDENKWKWTRLSRVGKVSYLRHYFIPEQNNGKDYYVYCINSFI